MKTVKITSAKLSENGKKVILEFSQVVDNPTQAATASNALGIFNKSDDRFNQRKPRRHWMAAEIKDASDLLDVDFSTLKKGDEMPLDIENPMVEGKPLQIQVVEETTGNDYDNENLSDQAKQYTDSKTEELNYIVTKDDQPIFSRTSVVLGEPKHVFIKDTKTVSEDEFAGIAEAYLAKAPAIAAAAGK